MSFWSAVADLVVPKPDVNERSASEFPDMNEQLAAIRRAQAGARPWRPASVDEAMGVPAILGAVTLIANTVGSLSLEAYRRGQLITTREDVPRLIIRPNPLTAPRAFFRDTALYLATRGEAWWWVAKRDPRDGSAMSLFPVPPWEVKVEENQRNRLRPTILWNNQEIPNEDMRQITYLPGTFGRGKGPLQLAGAAVSVGVEADHWAANFFSGSVPSFVGETDLDLDEAELLQLDAQWVEKPNNLPRWLTQGIKLANSPFDAQKAQMTETRQFQVAEVARMFNMPGSLLEHNMAGSSLRYQNDETIWSDFQRRCLRPNYLEPIQQEISDLLTRSTIARFNTDELLRASDKTRAEVYEKLVPIGVMTREEARRSEGLASGNTDFEPVPVSPPSTVPTRLPFERSALQDLHCPKCGRMAGRVAGPAEIQCKRCGTLVAA
jgi:HK97 family phage portal protein